LLHTRRISIQKKIMCLSMYDKLKIKSEVWTHYIARVQLWQKYCICELIKKLDRTAFCVHYSVHFQEPKILRRKDYFIVFLGLIPRKGSGENLTYSTAREKKYSRPSSNKNFYRTPFSGVLWRRQFVFF
jgi:hypothetical protein